MQSLGVSSLPKGTTYVFQNQKFTMGATYVFQNLENFKLQFFAVRGPLWTPYEVESFLVPKIRSNETKNVKIR